MVHEKEDRGLPEVFPAGGRWAVEENVKPVVPGGENIGLPLLASLAFRSGQHEGHMDDSRVLAGIQRGNDEGGNTQQPATRLYGEDLNGESASQPLFFLTMQLILFFFPCKS